MYTLVGVYTGQLGEPSGAPFFVNPGPSQRGRVQSPAEERGLEISVRPVLAIIVVLALVVGLAYLAVPRLAPLVTELTHQAATPTAVAPVAATPAGGPAVTYLDESLGWDWSVSCEPQFRTFLAQRLVGQRIRSVKVTLVDYREELKLPFGTQYPDRNGPLAVGNCADETLAGDFACRVAVKSGEPGSALDVAVTVNAPYTLLDMFLARGPNPNEIRKTWGWTIFQPLLAPVSVEANTWQSSCLHLSRTP